MWPTFPLKALGATVGLSQVLPTLRDHGLFLPHIQYIKCFRHFIFFVVVSSRRKNKFALLYVIITEISMNYILKVYSLGFSSPTLGNNHNESFPQVILNICSKTLFTVVIIIENLAVSKYLTIQTFEYL